jgi:peptidoglycan hydrolase CwlO-like protein
MPYKSSYDAETAILQLENELKQAIKDSGIIEGEINTLRRKALEIEVQKDDLREPMRKSRENIKRIEIELRTTKTEFWRLKNENL